MLHVYTYAKCSTCRKAVKFLQTRKIAFREIPIRETPPSPAEIRAMLNAHDGQLRKLFNTSGLDYKAMSLSKKLPDMKESDALKLLAGNGNLIRRPFVIGGGIHLVGFDETAWRAAFAK